jgi:TPR repeat protein
MKLFQTTSAIGASIVLLAGLFAGCAWTETKDVQPALSQLFDQALPQGCGPEARAEVMARANAGDMKAQHLIGMQAYLGTCNKARESNRKETIFYLSKSAAQFYPPSMFHLAENLGFEENLSYQTNVKRFHLYLGAAERGFHKAEFNVAMYYFDQRSVMHNDPQAYAWLSQCALHDRAFCRDEYIAAVRARMNKQDMEKAEQLKVRLLEKMKAVPKFEDVFCCFSGTGFRTRRE